MTFAELKRLKAKIRRGDATKAEQERYRDLTVQGEDHSERHQSRGISIIDVSHRNDPIMQNLPHNIGTKRKFDSVREEADRITGNGKWQRMEVAHSKVDELCRSYPPSIETGIMRTAKATSCPSAEISASVKKPSALLDALRASKATRGQQQHLVKALHASPTTSKMLSRVASARVVLSRDSSISSASSGQNTPGEDSTTVGRPSAQEEARYHSLTGMQYSAAMMSQALPASLSVEAFQSNPNMSATHLLRRFGNPHRRVVHQMLREQHERILSDMQRHSQQLRATSVSGVDAGGDDDNATTNTK